MKTGSIHSKLPAEELRIEDVVTWAMTNPRTLRMYLKEASANMKETQETHKNLVKVLKSLRSEYLKDEREVREAQTKRQIDRYKVGEKKEGLS